MISGHSTQHCSTNGAKSLHITIIPPQGPTAWGRAVYFAEQVGEFLSKKLEQSHDAVIAIYLRIASFVTSGRSDIISPDSYSCIFKQQIKKLSDTEFYSMFSDLTWSGRIPDKALLLTPNIDKYPEAYCFPPEKIDIMHLEYIHRQHEVKRWSIFKGLTESKISFMMKQDPLIKIFTDHLRKRLKIDFYSDLAKRAVDISRGNPTSEYPLGEVQLPSDIRNSNQSMIKNLIAEADKVPKPISNYILYLKNYSSTEEPLSFDDWLCPVCNPD